MAAPDDDIAAVEMSSDPSREAVARIRASAADASASARAAGWDKPTVSTEKAAFLRPPTAQEAVKAEILRRITAGEIRLGNVIRQETIAKELGLSQAPVREALKVLVGMGVVIYEPHHGHRLREFSESDLHEVYRLRTMLEAEVLRAAVANMTDEVLARLDELIELMESLEPTTQIFELKEANERFHMTIFDTASMPYFVEQIQTAWSRTRPYRSLLYNPPEERRRLNGDHRAMVEALREHNADEVIRLHDLHRKAALQKLHVVFERMHDGSDSAAFNPTEPISVDPSTLDATTTSAIGDTPVTD